MPLASGRKADDGGGPAKANMLAHGVSSVEGEVDRGR